MPTTAKNDGSPSTKRTKDGSPKSQGGGGGGGAGSGRDSARKSKGNSNRKKKKADADAAMAAPPPRAEKEGIGASHAIADAEARSCKSSCQCSAAADSFCDSQPECRRNKARLWVHCCSAAVVEPQKFAGFSTFGSSPYDALSITTLRCCCFVACGLSPGDFAAGFTADRQALYQCLSFSKEKVGLGRRCRWHHCRWHRCR